MLIYITTKCSDLRDIEAEAELSGAEQEVAMIANKYFEDKEYVLLEFNTENGTARVVPNSEQSEMDEGEKF